MESTDKVPASTEEIAEVIDLIDELAREGDIDRSLSLCRNVATLTKTPQLALHGILKLIEGRHTTDIALVAGALRDIARAHADTRWIQFRCGHHFAEIGLLDQGITCYERSIELKPSIKSHHQVAQLYRRRSDFDNGVRHLEAALEIAPDNGAVRSDLLNLVAMQGDMARFEAVAARGDLEQGHLAACYNRLGQTLVEKGDSRRAMNCLEKAVALAPEYFAYRWSKLLTPSNGYRSDKDFAKARKRYLAGLTAVEEAYDALTPAEQDIAYRCTEQLTNQEVHCQSADDIAVQKPTGQLLHRVMAHAFPRYMAQIPRRHPGNSRRLRVGFVSPTCFIDHPFQRAFGAWATELDSERFEVFGYTLTYHHDDVTNRMAQAMEHFVPFGGDAVALRQRIVADEPDVLVYPDVGLDPRVHQLAPLRLAPVQCAGWGHPVTTGLPNIDYFLGGQLMEPDNAQANYTETLVRLPHLGVSQAPSVLPPLEDCFAPAILAGRSRATTLFLCTQDPRRMVPGHDYLFARILQGLPDAELWFVDSIRDDATRAFVRRLARTCESYGVDFHSRCVVLPRLSLAEQGWVISEVDALLDTSFWSGYGSTFDALARGTPVITMPGGTMRGRRSFAILRHLGLDDLVSGTEQEYVALAVRLTTDHEFRAHCTAKIETARENLFGDDEVIRDLENFLDRSLTGDV